MKFWSSKQAGLPVFDLVVLSGDELLYPCKIHKMLSLSHVCIPFSSKVVTVWKEPKAFVPALCSALATTLGRQETALIKLFVFLRGLLLPRLTLQSSNTDQEQLNNWK